MYTVYIMYLTLWGHDVCASYVYLCTGYIMYREPVIWELTCMESSTGNFTDDTLQVHKPCLCVCVHVCVCKCTVGGCVAGNNARV